MLNPSLYSNNDVSSQNSALVITKMKTIALPRGESQKDKQWCDHCNKPYRTQETYWKIHDKPAKWKPQIQRKSTQSAYMADLEPGKSTNLTLSTNQMELVHQLLNQTLL